MESNLPHIMAHIDREIKAAINDAGHYGHSQIRRRAPHKLGKYRDSIRLVFSEADHVFYARVGTDDFRRHWLEFGTRGHSTHARVARALSWSGATNPVASANIPAHAAHPHFRPGGELMGRRLVSNLEKLGLRRA